MDNESFKETIFRQYTEEMHEILVESEQDGHFDANHFNEQLSHIWKSANIDCITQDEFYGLVEHELSSHMEEIIFPFDILKKAA